MEDGSNLKRSMKQRPISLLLFVLWLFACQQPKEQAEVHKEPTSEKAEEVTWPHQHTPDEIARIKRVIRLFKEREIAELATLVNYPLERKIPVPWIKNEKEFIQRFDELFDAAYVDELAKGNMDDWTVGNITRIRYKEYDIYMFDSLIDGVNYQSPKEKKRQQYLIQQEKKSIHPSLRKYEKPIFKVVTTSYLIRIDQLKEGQYRYASWKKGATDDSKPDLVLRNDTLVSLGSGGNHVYPFNHGNYRYLLYRNHIGCATTQPFTLEVEKDGKMIFTEEGTQFGR